jgi:hypothetical protein
MDAQLPITLVEHFSGMTDPGIERTKRHKLIDILVIAICATICGADGWAKRPAGSAGITLAVFRQMHSDWEARSAATGQSRTLYTRS